LGQVCSEKIAVYGLGFVGLPLALSFSMRGCSVKGVDINQELVEELNQSVTHHLENYGKKSIQDILHEELKSGRFAATNKSCDAADCTTFIITVGIPVVDEILHMGHLEGACKAVAKNLKSGDLVLLRSTVVPGTTEEFVLPILERDSGLKAGVDYYLAYASERIAEGRAFEEFENMPAVVGGINKQSLDAGERVLAIITKAPIHRASQVKVVEAAKVMENISRDVNIAMANEFARLSKAVGIDTFEVIQVANTHKRVNILTPGPGVGGYCIPNAFYYLQPKAEEYDVNLSLLHTARTVNDRVPHFVVKLIADKLAGKNKELRGSKIAALGLAMKDFSNDDRISPAVQIVELLLSLGANVKAYDPAVPTVRNYKVDSLEECLDGADVVLVLARQHGLDIDPETVSLHATSEVFIVDTRNCVNKQKAKNLRMDVVGI
jgi:UDP-N-acetyl-D-mannosaminuronic acid dehydrogenase